MKTPTVWAQPSKTKAQWSLVGRLLALWVVINPGNSGGYNYNDASRNYDDSNFQYDYALVGGNTLNQRVPTQWSNT